MIYGLLGYLGNVCFCFVCITVVIKLKGWPTLSVTFDGDKQRSIA